MCTTDDEVCRLPNMFCKIKYIVFKIKTELHSELCQTIKTERFAKRFINHKPLTMFGKCSLLDAWQGSEYAFVIQI